MSEIRDQRLEGAICPACWSYRLAPREESCAMCHFGRRRAIHARRVTEALMARDQDELERFAVIENATAENRAET